MREKAILLHPQNENKVLYSKVHNSFATADTWTEEKSSSGIAARHIQHIWETLLEHQAPLSKGITLLGTTGPLLQKAISFKSRRHV